jgi:putative ABC transport system substrate-binding protein
MRRLAFLLLMLAAPAAAQTAGQEIYRLGVLASSVDSIELTRNVTLPELARLGFSEGRNLVVETRFGNEAALPALARELLLARPGVIMAIGGEAIRAAYDASRTVPIVSMGIDPVGQGYAASLARPGGNVTGVVILGAELDAKRLEMLSEAVPQARRVAALMLPSAPGRQASERALRAVAASAGLEILIFDAAEPGAYPAAFAAMRTAGAQALLIMAHAVFYRDAATLTALAAESRLPTVCEWAEMAASFGCMLGYGPSRTELRRRMARYAARIFQGALPGDLPIELPVQYEFAINLRIARALAIAIPPALLIRADEVIE